MILGWNGVLVFDRNLALTEVQQLKQKNVGSCEGVCSLGDFNPRNLALES